MNTHSLKTRLQERKYDELFKDIYQDETLIDHQYERYLAALDKFVSLYGDDEVMVFSVPGRSEVGGNHTDHQQGEVLACAINMDMIAIVRKARHVGIVSDGRKINVQLDDLKMKEEEKNSSKSLVKGVLARLEYLGHRIGGFECLMTSDVPVGSGMSSSAAYEVMIGKIISGLYNRDSIDSIELAKVAQYAENVYFGKPSGLMDQMACSVGNLIHIDFKDKEEPIVKKVEVDFAKYNHCLCLVNTKGSHANLTDEYAAIPQDMATVSAYFGKTVLRDVSYEQLMANITQLRQQCSDRALLRAIHVILENGRVEQEVKALEQGDFDEFLKILKASGDSSYRFLQNVYAASKPLHQEVSLGICISEQCLVGHGAVRVHGGGFAGTIQAFVANDYVSQYSSVMQQVFGDDCCLILKVRKYGAMVVFN